MILFFIMNPFSYPITFLPCKNLDQIHQFYENVLQLEVALEQGQCIIYKIGESPHISYWGFCSHYDEFLKPAHRVCLTLVVSTRTEVDSWHQKLVSLDIDCSKPPKYTEQFKIYNAFYRDPMGYTIEIQSFDENAKPKFS